jgi:hypothetical protein
MHTGMLWFDNSQTELDVKIRRAVDYYHKKYGRTPDLCLIHPSLITDSNKVAVSQLKITVRAYRPVLPGHIWVGVEDKT